MTVSLTGFMGCGKSSVGEVLSRLLCLPFVDLDKYVEEREGRTVSQIFSDEGEAGFREAELNALREVLDSGRDCVLALGGGTVTTPQAADMVHRRTRCIYLRATADSLSSWISGQDIDRPMLRTCGVAELLERRRGIYESVAHHILDVDSLNYDQAAQAVMDLLNKG